MDLSRINDSKTKNRKTRFINQFVTVLLGFSLLSLSQIANAIPITGKVYLDYDGNSKTALPLKNISVEAEDGQGAHFTTVTEADGSYSFDVDTIGNYTIKAITTSNESATTNVIVSGGIGATSNIFLQGEGGALQVSVIDSNSKGLKIIPVTVSSSNMSEQILQTNDNGKLDLLYSLKNDSYTVTVTAEDIISDSQNGSQYALWDMTINGVNGFGDTYITTMSGTNESVTYNVRESNEWGADGVVAVDQNEDGLFSNGRDTPLEGFSLNLYYQGTNQQVIGQPTLVTKSDGKYRFKNLPLGDYTVEIMNVKAPWLLSSPASTRVNFSVVIPNNQPSASNFLLNIQESDTSIPGLSGTVFALGATQAPLRGPDGGANNITKPNSSSKGLATPISLYQRNKGSWTLFSNIDTQADGAFWFKGLPTGYDYKLVLDESGINRSSYYFIGDADGKSSSTDPDSLSSHKGQVTLSDSSKESIKGKEIIAVNLTNRQQHQNFWYSPIKKANFYANLYHRNIEGRYTWGAVINGLSSASMAGYFSGHLFEEDGVTPLVLSNGTLVEEVTTAKLTTVAKIPTKLDYGTVGRTVTPIDHASVMVLKIEDYDDNRLLLVSPLSSVIIASANNVSTNVEFKAEPANSISGRIYLNVSHPGAQGTFDPDSGDVATPQVRITLHRDRNNGVGSPSWQIISYYASGDDGAYSFTNLPDGRYRVKTEKLYGAEFNLDKTTSTIENNVTDSGNELLVVSVNGGEDKVDQDIWFKFIPPDFVLSGEVYLDTYLNDGEITAPPQTNNYFDLYLAGATVLLCEDNNISDCYIGGTDYLSHQVIGSNGKYEFRSNSKNGYVLEGGKNYIVKVEHSSAIAVNNGTLSDSYSITMPMTATSPIINRFLMQGVGHYQGLVLNDINGDKVRTGAVTGTNPEVPDLSNLTRLVQKFYMWNSTNNSWLSMGEIGTYYSEFELYSLPAGKYRHVLQQTGSGSKALPIADSDPATEPGVIEFEILSDGSIADGKGDSKRYVYYAAESGAVRAIEGGIYLDVTGSGIKDSSSVLLSGEAVGNAKVTGYFTPRFYENYTIGEGAVLSTPDFVDTNLSENDGKFSFDSTTATSGKVYVTNTVLRLDNLPPQYELVANSGSKQSYLNTSIQNDLTYMQVTPPLNGAVDQYWLVKLKNKTKITGQLYYDSNKNGHYDVGVDTVQSGVRVEVWKNDRLYSFTRSDINGNYIFEGLIDGDYEVKATTDGLNQELYELEDPLNGYVGLKIDNLNSPIINDQDFIYKKIGEASINGYIMLDVNNNAIFDLSYDKLGDIPLNTVTVELYKNSVEGLSYMKTATNSKGYFSFSGIELNTTYVVKIVSPSGYGVISNFDGNNTEILNNIVIGATPSSEINKYFLLAGSTNTNPSGGINDNSAKNSGIAGITVIDNGTDTPLSDVLVSLRDSTGKELARQVTNSAGEYQFYNLADGTYSIYVVDAPSGYAITGNVSGTAPIDTISGLNLSGSGISGQFFKFKNASPDGIQGTVFVDFGADNQVISHDVEIDSNDFPLQQSGIKVELFDGLGASGLKLAETVTDINGVYKFPNLLYGTGSNYSVRIDTSTLLADYQFELSKAGVASLGEVHNISDLAYDGSVDNHYFVTGKLTLSGNVWLDSNNNLTQDTDELVSGIDAKLYYQAPGDTNLSLLKSMPTDTTGAYSFTSLPKGTNYQIKIDSSSSTLNGTSLIPSIGSHSIINNNDTYDFVPLNGDENKSTAYQYNGKISGKVIIDVDNSQSYLFGVDQPLGGVDLELTATINGNTVTRTATTQTDGSFSVEYLAPASWQIASAASQSISDWNYYQLNYVLDSAANKTIGTSALPLSESIAVTNGAIDQISGIEIGYKGSAKISGYVVIDSEPSSTHTNKQAGDIVIAGVPVTLTASANGFTHRVTHTDSNGYYEFTDLSIYNYDISVDNSHNSLSNYVISFDGLGHTTSSSPVATSRVTIPVTTNNAELIDKDFGYKGQLTWSGHVTRDIDASGSLTEIDEAFSSALTVTLTRTDVTPNLVKTTTTSTVEGEQGAYRFTDLMPGTWQASIATPSNYAPSYIPTEQTVVFGSNVQNMDIGFKGTGSYSGLVVYDNNANNVYDTGIDSPIKATINVTLTGGAGFTSKEVAINSTTGAYTLSDLDEAYSGYIVTVNHSQTNFPLGWVASFAPYDTENGNSVTIDWTKPVVNNHFGFSGNGTLSGTVLVDIDGSESRSGVDTNVAGLDVTLSATINGVVITKTATTDTNGQFSFDGLAAGNWSLNVPSTQSVTNWSDYKPSYSLKSDGTTKAVGSSTLPVTETITINAGVLSQLSGIEIGYKGSAKISGYVVIDSEPSSTHTSKQAGDIAVEGVPVTLTASDNGFTDRVINTDSNGYYEFTDLVAYNYDISVNDSHSSLSNYVISFDGLGRTASSSPIAASRVTIPVTAINANLTDKDFGYKGELTWSGHVTRDIDASGSLTEIDEAFSSALTVTLTRTDVTPNLVKTTTTSTVEGERGAYRFTDLMPGTWQVSIVAPSDYAPSYTPTEQTVVFGSNVQNMDIGFKGTGSYSGLVVYDNNANNVYDTGIDSPIKATINVTLTGGTGFTSKEVAINSTTGAYTLSDLDEAYSGYIVTVNNSQPNFPLGWAASFAPYDTENSNSVTIDWTKPVVDNHFGFSGNGTLSGTVLVDVDGSESRSGVDTYFSGLDVTLSATINGVVITKTATTNTNGQFNFDGLAAGNWSLSAATTQSVANWADYQPSYSLKSDGSTKATGSNALPLTETIAIKSGALSQLSGIEMGYKGSAKISGYVVIDIDPEDNVLQKAANDVAVKNVSVTLGAEDSGFTSKTIRTDDNGYYEFSGLVDYTYQITVDSNSVELSGHTLSFDGLAQAAPTATNIISLPITSTSEILQNKDFGYSGNGVISGVIYRDLGGLGIAHVTVDNDAKLAGVLVKAEQNGVIRYSDVTASDGKYSIKNLSTGLWQVTLETLPDANLSFSYTRDLNGATATEITTGAEIDINPKLTRAAVKEGQVSFGIKADSSLFGRVVIDIDDTVPTTANIDTNDISVAEVKADYQVKLMVKNTEVAVAQVATDGSYTFSHLSPDTDYEIYVSAPTASYQSSFNVEGNLSSAAAVSTNDTDSVMRHTYRFTDSNGQVTASNFGWKGAGSISGNIFWDKNDNGLFESGIDTDLGVPLTMTLTTTNSALSSVSITRTIASGDTAYQVTGLVPGVWQVVLGDVPNDYKASFDPDDTYSPTAIAATANIAQLNVTSQLTNQHFGYIKGGIITGAVKEDSGENGLYDPNHPGIEHVEIVLLDSSGTAMTHLDGQPKVSNTNAQGEFHFRNLDTTQRYQVQGKFGPDSDNSNPLFEMDASYDSEIGAITGSVSTVNNGVHTLLADISSATNNEITPADLYFGYRALGGELVIQKLALKDNVVVGDLVPYSITITNNNTATVTGVIIKDTIPAGFKYVAGSARLDGVKISDPTGSRPIYFKDINVGGTNGTSEAAKRTLTYLLVVGSGVTQGEYTNTAVALGRSNQDISNVAKATVTVTSDPLFDNALIFGKVFIDRNGNGIQDGGEEGLGGVKLVTARGQIITTDSHGRYHLAGVSGGRWERGTNFVLKLDPRSLPKGYRFIKRNPIVVRLSPGLPSKIDFAVSVDK